MKADITIEGFGLIHAEIIPTELKGRKGFCCMVRIRGEIFSTVIFQNGLVRKSFDQKPNWEMLKCICGLDQKLLDTIVVALRNQDLKTLRQRKQKDLLMKTLKASRN